MRKILQISKKTKTKKHLNRTRKQQSQQHYVKKWNSKNHKKGEICMVNYKNIKSRRVNNPANSDKPPRIQLSRRECKLNFYIHWNVKLKQQLQ